MILYEGQEYRDDRMFVINLNYAEIETAITEKSDKSSLNLYKPQKREMRWALTTYRNTVQLPSNGTIDFDSKEDAIKYLKEVEPVVPLISNYEQSLDIPSDVNEWKYWLDWLDKNQLFSAITEKQHVPYYWDKRGWTYKKQNISVTKIIG